MQLLREVERHMRKDGDYASYYHVPITGKISYKIGTVCGT